MEDTGYITRVLERFFHLLKMLPPQCFVEERVAHQKKLHSMSPEDRKAAMRKRLKRTESIIASYILLYIVSLFFLVQIQGNAFLMWFLVVVLSLRLIDIIQVNVNISIFDHTRLVSQTPTFVFSAARSIILVSHNFIEIALIFGFYYTFLPGSLECKAPLMPWDYFYFSFITQLTIGYGDITPADPSKGLVVFQALLGYFFTILIVSRVINILPKIISEKEIEELQNKASK